MKINLLDLFSGIGGFSLGLKEAGFEINKHFYSEIDKHAIATYKHKFEDAEYVGSVTDVRGSSLPKINAITFGSPCQDFSLAGKRAGMGGERSSLISHAIRLIAECRPDFFIWENVKGTFSSNAGEDFWAIIKAFTHIGGYRLEWQLLNTAWFLPQNRERIYLVGRLADKCSGEVFPIEESDWNPDKARQQQAERLLVNCIDSGYGKGADGKRTVIKEATNLQGNKVANTIRSGGRGSKTKKHNLDIVKVGTWCTHKDGQGFREVSDGNSPTIPARAREDGSGQPVIKMGAIRGRNPNNPKSRDAELLTEQMVEINESDQKSNCLSTVQKDNALISGVAMERAEKGKELRKGYEAGKIKHGFNEHRKEVLRKDGLSNCLDTNVKSQKIGLGDKSTIRRLTEVECERLQGFPDDWTKHGLYLEDSIHKYIYGNRTQVASKDKKKARNSQVSLHRSEAIKQKMFVYAINRNRVQIKKVSSTQRYKCLGNAVTVDVVRAVGERVLRCLAD